MLSGGRTSGRLLAYLLENVPDFREEWLVFFGNTGKERHETLDFIHEMETRWNVPIAWGEYVRVPAASIPAGIYPDERRNKNLREAAERGENAHWFKIVDYATAARNGEPFDALNAWTPGLPNPVGRACSTQMKFRTCARWMFANGHAEYAPAIGIREDEKHRKASILATCDSYEHPTFLLIDSWKTTVGDVRAFWAAQPFDLRLQSYEGNCDLCFLKSLPKRVRIARERPELVKWWADWEQAKQATARAANGAEFHQGQPFTRIIDLAKQDVMPFGEADEDIPCSCAERGMERDESV